MFLFTAAFGWLYWNAPNIETFRPSIENYLQQELELDSLKLGDLSWYWAGFLWIEMDKLHFSSHQHGIAFDGGKAMIRIPLPALFSGDLLPDKIKLKHGILEITFDDSPPPVLPHHLIIDDTQVNWFYRDMQGTFTHVQLTTDAVKRTLKAHSSELQLSARWDENWRPEHIQLHCKHLNWLPEEMRQHFKGIPQADMRLSRTGSLDWELKASIDSDHDITFNIPHSQHLYRFHHASTDIQISLKPTHSDISTDQSFIDQINIRALQWRFAEHQVLARGQWKNGQLHIKATSQQIPMRFIWPALKPFGNASFHRWQALMQQGIAKDIEASISLAWPMPLQKWPDNQAWEKLQFDLNAKLEDAEIALGMSNDSLTHLYAQLHINQDALNAHIEDTVLPHNLGHASGDLRLPWNTLDLHINGKAPQTEVQQLLRWLDYSDPSRWTWNQGKTSSQFHLLWNATSDSPEEASASFTPIGNWSMTALGFPLQFSQGQVLWDQEKGIRIKDLQLSNQHLQGQLSLQAKAINGDWQLTSLHASSSSELSPLAAHFELPISHPQGHISSTLSYDNGWFGTVDMHNASWEHLLGTRKKVGQAFALQYQATFDSAAQYPSLHINKITTSGHHIHLANSSNITINKHSLKAQINHLSTPSFTGDLKINIPFANNKPWEIDVNASHLNRNALPKKLDHHDNNSAITWLLRADIDRFDWNNAQISGVHIRLSSEKNSLGIMQAAQIHTPQLDVLNVDARFTLPGQGHIELRKLSASFEQQELIMSATLRPLADGSMRWKGFAELHGDFGHLMQKSGLSNRFTEGDARLLFSGQGLILKEQPWWQGLDGRLRLRVDQGRILEGGTLTTLLSVINISQLPALLFGQRKDLSGPGILFERLQMEAIMQNHEIRIRNVVMRSSAFDLIGQGSVDVKQDMMDIYLIAKPLQNLDALLAKIPLLRDMIGGRSHSFLRKIYHLSGPFSATKVKQISAKEAGLSQPGIFDRLFSTPDNWFGNSNKNTPPLSQ